MPTAESEVSRPGEREKSPPAGIARPDGEQMQTDGSENTCRHKIGRIVVACRGVVATEGKATEWRAE